MAINELNAHIEQIRNDLNEADRVRLNAEIDQLMETIRSMTDEVRIINPA